MFRLALVLLLTGCTTAPAHLTAAKAAVDGGKVYVYYKGWSRPAHLKPHEGKCLDYALAYEVKVSEMGYEAPMATTCYLADGTKHAVLDVDGWRLDNRYSYVMRTTESDCR